MRLDRGVQKALLVIIAAIFAGGLGILVTSAIFSIPPLEYNGITWSIVVAGAFLAAVVTKGANFQTGILAGASVTLLAAASLEFLVPSGNYLLAAAIIIGILCGSLTYQSLAWLLLVIPTIGWFIYKEAGLGPILTLLPAFAAGLLVSGSLNRLIIELGRPIRQIKTHWPALVAFFSVYLALITFYALMYNLIFLSLEDAFKGQDINSEGLDFVFFMHYSTLVITNGSLAGLSPTNRLTRILTASEVLLGVFWLVVYFQFLFIYLTRKRSGR